MVIQLQHTITSNVQSLLTAYAHTCSQAISRTNFADVAFSAAELEMSGTICRRTSDSCTCHTSISDIC